MDQTKTIDSAILELMAILDKSPQKGLYIWETLLFPNDFDYKNFICKISDEILKDDIKDKTQLNDFKETISNLQQIREQMSLNPKVKLQIEKIKSDIISQIASELIINEISNKFNDSE